MISMDIRKAFDSVSHHCIIRGLRRFQISPYLIDYIQATLTSSSTIFCVGQKKSKSVPINRGVRQGDPMSPLLFNIVLDELVGKLSHISEGCSMGDGVNCSLIAFANDLVLLAETERSLQECAALSRETWPVQVYKRTKIETGNPVTGHQERDLAHFMTINAANEDKMTKWMKTIYPANELESHKEHGGQIKTVVNTTKVINGNVESEDIQIERYVTYMEVEEQKNL